MGRNDIKRGYCGIGVYNIKSQVNVGTLWRSAFCLGASFIFTIGQRIKKQASDTTKSYRHVPLFEYIDWEDFDKHSPYDCQRIAVELTDDATPLERFIHPDSAVYILGPEDGDLPLTVLNSCQHTIRFSSTFCLNVAVAGSIVLYDRNTKANLKCSKLVLP